MEKEYEFSSGGGESCLFFVRRSGPFDLDLKSFLDLTVGFCDNELESGRD